MPRQATTPEDADNPYAPPRAQVDAPSVSGESQTEDVAAGSWPVLNRSPKRSASCAIFSEFTKAVSPYFMQAGLSSPQWVFQPVGRFTDLLAPSYSRSGLSSQPQVLPPDTASAIYARGLRGPSGPSRSQSSCNSFQFRSATSSWAIRRLLPRRWCLGPYHWCQSLRLGARSRCRPIQRLQSSCRRHAAYPGQGQAAARCEAHNDLDGLAGAGGCHRIGLGAVMAHLWLAGTVGPERVSSTSMSDGHRRFHEASKSGKYVRPAAESSTAMD